MPSVDASRLQTTLGMLLRLFGKLAESKHFPDLEVMILRPDLTKPLRIWNSNKATDRQYWKAVREAGKMSKAAQQFIHQEYPRVQFEERFFPFDPCVKAIIGKFVTGWFPRLVGSGR